MVHSLQGSEAFPSGVSSSCAFPTMQALFKNLGSRTVSVKNVSQFPRVRSGNNRKLSFRAVMTCEYSDIFVVYLFPDKFNFVDGS